jgi:hypothetical protein
VSVRGTTLPPSLEPSGSSTHGPKTPNGNQEPVMAPRIKENNPVLAIITEKVMNNLVVDL